MLGYLASGLGIVGGFAKMVSGSKMKRDARRAAQQFRRQELKNVEAGRRISTLGADLAREEQARATATTMDALRQGGIRGVVGGAGSVLRENNNAARRIGAGLDEQRVALDKDFAVDEARIRRIQEERDNMELSAIQQQLNAGQQTMFSGLGDLAQSGFGIAQMQAMQGMSGMGDTETPETGVQARQVFAPNPFGVVNPMFQSYMPYQRPITNTFTGQEGYVNPITGRQYGK